MVDYNILKLKMGDSALSSLERTCHLYLFVIFSLVVNGTLPLLN